MLWSTKAWHPAHLQHTRIVTVHYVGCEQGVHFYAMQYIEGQTLAKVIADLRLQIADSQKRTDHHDYQTATAATQDRQPAPPVPQAPTLQTPPSSRTYAPARCPAT